MMKIQVKEKKTVETVKGETKTGKEMKELIKTLRKNNKSIDYNIFKALDNINLNCVLGTKKNGVYTSFLNSYDEHELSEKK